MYTYKEHIYSLMMSLILLTGFSACQTYDLDIYEDIWTDGNGLTIIPLLSQAQTRAVGDEELGNDDFNENKLNTLDVFVAEKGTNAIVKQWHLTIASATSKTVEEKVRYLLESKWANSNLDRTKTYTVYVAVNNGVTKIADPTATGYISTVAELQAAHVKDVNIFTHKDEENYRATGDDTHEYGTDSYADDSKEFVMSGVIPEWNYNSNNAEQVFSVNLERAAAKIVVDLEFTQDFIDSWTYELDYEVVNGVVTKTPKRDSNGRLIFKTYQEGDDIPDGYNVGDKIPKTTDITTLEVGTPAWRYGNFVVNADVFNPASTGITSTLTQESKIFGWMIRDELEYGSKDAGYPFQILTYSYPYTWAKADAINKAPFIIFSVGYAIDDVQPNVRGYDYYRIPIVDELVTDALKRNHIYKVKVKIDSFGSVGLNEAVDLHPQYEVLPWNEEAADNSNLIGKNLDYLMVQPTEFTLRGNGKQEVSLNFFKPSGKKLIISEAKIYYKNASGTTVSKGSTQYNSSTADGISATEETKISYNGTGITYNTATGTYNATTNTGGVIIDATSSPQSGTFDISSYALDNHAVKYIEFKVTLEGTSLSRTVRLQHFPLDNIQGASGLWSSRYGVKNVTRTYTYYTYSQYQANQNTIIREGPQGINGNPFGWNNWPNNGTHNSEATAVSNQYGSSSVQGDGWFYFRTSTWFGYDYYRVRYYTYSDTETNDPWVEYNVNSTRNYTRSDDIFSARVYYNGNIYEINPNNTGWRGGNTGLKNNNKYIIQISSTSSDYVLGRPTLDGDYKSGDHVVSPAFMIASQLAATTSQHPERDANDLTGSNSYYQKGLQAAKHCGTYMEVDGTGTNETRWTGWRLPTREEVGIILQYQNAGFDTMSPVMTGSYYWTLEGAAVATGINEETDQWDANWSTMFSDPNNDYINRANDDRYYSGGYYYNLHNTYIRCVRDLSESEVKKLNGN